MYTKRIKVFIILASAFLLVCLARLAEMQLVPDSYVRDRIAKLRFQQGRSRPLKTIRGSILDRKGRVLAADELEIQLYINYKLSCCGDERVQKAKLLEAVRKENPETAIAKVTKELKGRIDDLQRVIDKCVYFGFSRGDIAGRIREINDEVWNSRIFQAWARNAPDKDIIKKYGGRKSNVPLSVALTDFAKEEEDEQIRLAGRVDIAEMHQDYELLKLETDDDIFTAQFEFMEVNNVAILPKEYRLYPYNSVAAQTIGWVGPVTGPADKKLFADDRLASYMAGELCGREDGVEYVCESILRGRRGEEVYDIDRELVGRTETKLGRDVSLTLDIELQKQIEEYLADYDHDPNAGPGMAAVVIDVASGDILTMASLPVFNLNRVRYDYGDFAGDPHRPLINRAINAQYPPGSVIKPLIVVAGLESGKITAGDVISCPAQAPPKGWPRCWIQKKYPWKGHDDDGPNNARNAIKGSCNIYFSRLADRLDSSVLQQWLFKFGYGRELTLAPAGEKTSVNRDLRQLQGTISSTNPPAAISSFDQLPPIEEADKRFFGIGQGNMRVTPLQVANAMACLARGGLYKKPRLFLNGEDEDSPYSSIALDISPRTLDVIYDGIRAVVNTPGGTAYSVFSQTDFSDYGVKVYGKTGSTEAPENAWFAGFAEDSSGRSIAIAVVVEGGQSGPKDAAPLGRDIISFCIEQDYLGKK